jgi:hypothetical protein
MSTSSLALAPWVLKEQKDIIRLGSISCQFLPADGSMDPRCFESRDFKKFFMNLNLLNKVIHRFLMATKLLLDDTNV